MKKSCSCHSLNRCILCLMHRGCGGLILILTRPRVIRCNYLRTRRSVEPFFGSHFGLWFTVYSPVISFKVKNSSFHKARPPSAIVSSKIRAQKPLKAQRPKRIARIKQETSTATAIRKEREKVTLPSHPLITDGIANIYSNSCTEERRGAEV